MATVEPIGEAAAAVLAVLTGEATPAEPISGAVAIQVVRAALIGSEPRLSSLARRPLGAHALADSKSLNEICSR